VSEGHHAATHARVLQQHASWSGRLRRRLALGERVEQIGEVQATVLRQDDVEARRLELDLGEGPRPAEDARELEIDEETIESQQRSPVGLLEPEALDLQLEQQRVETHLADL